MSPIKGSSFFCEDFRMEDSGQPMMIGMLSRDIELSADKPQLNSLYFVSFYYVSKAHEGISLKLNLDISHSGRDEAIRRGPFTKTFSDDGNLDDEEQLLTVCLPIDGLKLDVGTSITATLEVDDSVEVYRFQIRSMED